MRSSRAFFFLFRITLSDKYALYSEPVTFVQVFNVRSKYHLVFVVVVFVNSDDTSCLYIWWGAEDWSSWEFHHRGRPTFSSQCG